jgi:ankyrin repeat protein
MFIKRLTNSTLTQRSFFEKKNMNSQSGSVMRVLAMDSFVFQKILQVLPFASQMRSREVNRMWNTIVNTFYGNLFENQPDLHTVYKTGCRKGYQTFVEHLLKHNKIDLNSGLRWACLGGQKDLIKWLLDQPHDPEFIYDRVLKYACLSGNIEVVNSLLDEARLNGLGALLGACQGGHRELVDLLLSKGINHYDMGLIGACRGGHRDLVDLMLSKGATSYDSGLREACRIGHYELVDLMLSKGAIHTDWGLAAACRGDHQDLVSLMIDLGVHGRYCHYCRRPIEDHVGEPEVPP